MRISGSATKPNRKRDKLKHLKINNEKIRCGSNANEVAVSRPRPHLRLPTSHNLEDQSCILRAIWPRSPGMVAAWENFLRGVQPVNDYSGRHAESTETQTRLRKACRRTAHPQCLFLR